MSKLTKLIKHPVRFFTDAQKNKQMALVAEAERALAAKAAAKKAPAAKTSVVKQDAAKAPGILFANIHFNDDVAIYFDGKDGNYYQLEQWFAPLMELSKVRRVTFVLREREIFDRITAETRFQAVHCNSIDDLMQVYEQSSFKCIVYVNHAARNFQSLIHGKALHIHINHGESDKLSTITNQSKSYDFVYLVGDAAYDKYNLNLLSKDMSRYIKIGRPQIEHIARVAGPAESRLTFWEDPIEPSSLVHADTANSAGNADVEASVPEHASPVGMPTAAPVVSKRRKVVLYAPTWESTHESMNYSSLGAFGLAIVSQVLAHSDYYLIYKPHPNTGSRDAKLRDVNEQIKKLLTKHEKGEVVLSGDINSLYEHIDIAVFDNSAVAIDYLAVNKPMLMTDFFGRYGNRQDKPIVVNAARMLKHNDISSLIPIIADEISHDSRQAERQIVKRYFLGDFDYASKESTKRFIEEIDKACTLRDELAHRLSLQVGQHTPPI